MSSATEPRAHGGGATLILGVGNPILRDDRVGLEVARALHQRLGGAVPLREASVGSFELIPVLEGWRRVLIVDSAEPEVAAPGELLELRPEDLCRRHAPLSPHNAGLAPSLAFARACGLRMPEEVLVFVIGVRDPYTFDERCTPEVAGAVPGIVRAIEARVFGPAGCWSGAAAAAALGSQEIGARRNGAPRRESGR